LVRMKIRDGNLIARSNIVSGRVELQRVVKERDDAVADLARANDALKQRAKANRKREKVKDVIITEFITLDEKEKRSWKETTDLTPQCGEKEREQRPLIQQLEKALVTLHKVDLPRCEREVSDPTPGPCTFSDLTNTMDSCSKAEKDVAVAQTHAEDPRARAFNRAPHVAARQHHGTCGTMGGTFGANATRRLKPDMDGFEADTEMSAFGAVLPSHPGDKPVSRGRRVLDLVKRAVRGDKEC